MDETRHLQEVLLSCVDDISKVCKDNNIPYYMIGGTLLGAIRHKGFIPWDDDLDIGMKRTDYDRFIEVCKSCLDSEKYLIQTHETEECYAMSFGKVQLKGTEIIEDFSKNVPISHGIFVDIFPLDNIPDNQLAKKVFIFVNSILKNMIWIKCGYGTEKHKKRFQYKFLKFWGKFFSIKKLKKMRYKWITQYNSKNTAKCFICDYPKQQLLNSWLGDFAEYPFEGINLQSIKEYDSYLRMAYGDYMQLPPEEDRHVHSHYKINFGKY